MPSFLCHNCHTMIDSNYNTESQAVMGLHFLESYPTSYPIQEDAFVVTVRRCSLCNAQSVFVKGETGGFAKIDCSVLPQSHAKSFPEYIPSAIRNDYEEACAILKLSPKASATLSRRCLQGIIRDFFKIQNEKSLRHEIDAIKDKVPPTLWNAIDSLRRIGNIGAHMEKDVNMIIDVESEEAEKLVHLIERVIESTYIQQHEDEVLFSDITTIAEEKKHIKTALSSSNE